MALALNDQRSTTGGRGVYQLLPTAASLFIPPCPVARITAQVAVGIFPASRAVEHAKPVFHNDLVTAPMGANCHRNRSLLTPSSHSTSLYRSTTQICSPRHLLRCQSHDSRAGPGALAWPYPALALQLPNFTWGSCSNETFCVRINRA